MNLVYQFQVGDNEIYKELEKISSTSFKKYAEDIGASYKLENKRNLTKGHGCKNSLYFESLSPIFDEAYDVYDKILIADIDVVCNTTDNIFEVSDAEVYGVNEADAVSNKEWGVEDYRCVGEWDYNEEVYQKYVDKFEKHGYPYQRSAIGELGARYASKLLSLQAGVIVWTREARIEARKRFDDWQEFCYPAPKDSNDLTCSDQPYITGNLLKNNFDIECIDFRWNDNPENYINPKKEMHLIKFAHYGGKKCKKQMIEHANRGWFDKIKDYKGPRFKLTKRVRFWSGGVQQEWPVQF